LLIKKYEYNTILTEEKSCNDPTCKKTREGIQHKYHGREIIREKIPARIKLKREIASSIGITVCSKCGTRTKMIRTEPFSPEFWGSGNWVGYAICPKCGHKENWKEGE
jgi:hypothetical protein